MHTAQLTSGCPIVICKSLHCHSMLSHLMASINQEGSATYEQTSYASFFLQVATFFAVMKDTDWAQKKTFVTNFWHDWSKLLGKKHVIQKLTLCDFTPIYEWSVQEKEKKKSMTSEVGGQVFHPLMTNKHVLGSLCSLKRQRKEPLELAFVAVAGVRGACFTASTACHLGMFRMSLSGRLF